MNKIFNWNKWSVATKILTIFLSLLVISLSVIGILAVVNIRDLGNFANHANYALGESAIQDSTSHLNRLGEDMIRQKAQDVGRQVKMYFVDNPGMSVNDMRINEELRRIVLQDVGKEGYTTLIDSKESVIILHKYPERETSIISLKEYLPSFWTLLVSLQDDQPGAGYYDWQEVDGSIRKKFAAIEPIKYNGHVYGLWATTYIDEFTKPAVDTQASINHDINFNRDYIRNKVNNIQDTFAVIITALIMVVIALALVWSRLITRPINDLQKGTEEIARGGPGYQMVVKSQDELGQLGRAFNRMSVALKKYTDQLNDTAAENIEKEKQIQDNLRTYARLISEAQEIERKRVSRELHDETAQALVVVSRHLEDLAVGKGQRGAAEIREEVRKILEGVRRFSQELRPSILDDLGLWPAVKWLASDLTNTHKIPVAIEVTGQPRSFDKHTELILFRIIQEALTNVRKHAQASQVTVMLDYLDDIMKLTIIDNGIGFISPQKLVDLAVKGKLGLLGMQERVELVGGTLKIDSDEGKGTTLKIEIKYDNGKN
jgi:two-component system, NarL family, sensor histidine kinase DegS